MPKEILADMIGKKKMMITKAVLDKDAACHKVLLSRSPEMDIVYCGNHTAKTFHADPMPSRSVQRTVRYSISRQTVEFSSSVCLCKVK